MRKFIKADWVLLGLVILVFATGLPVLLSVAPEVVNRQLLWIFLGLIAFFFWSLIDYRSLEKMPFVFYFFAIFLLGLTFIFGEVTRGSTRWINLGFLNLQASEVAKPLIILAFSSWATQLDLRSIKNLGFLFFLMALVSLLIFFQPDLGSTMMIVFICLAIIFMAGLKIKFFLLFVLLTSASLPLIWRLLKTYQKARIFVFFNPFTDPQGKGYHLLQAMVAVGSGGLLGRGLGWGTQSHLRFLPEYHTDFIFASLAEELGLFGSLILLIIFWLLLWRILIIAQKTSEKFGYLICLGVFSLILFQVLVNIGMNLGLLPITGVPLPLVSYGGSSLLATMTSLGLVSSVAKHSKNEEILEIH